MSRPNSIVKFFEEFCTLAFTLNKIYDIIDLVSQ